MLAEKEVASKKANKRYTSLEKTVGEMEATLKQRQSDAKARADDSAASMGRPRPRVHSVVHSNIKKSQTKETSILRDIDEKTNDVTALQKERQSNAKQGHRIDLYQNCHPRVGIV